MYRDVYVSQEKMNYSPLKPIYILNETDGNLYRYVSNSGIIGRGYYANLLYNPTKFNIYKLARHLTKNLPEKYEKVLEYLKDNTPSFYKNKNVRDDNDNDDDYGIKNEDTIDTVLSVRGTRDIQQMLTTKE